MRLTTHQLAKQLLASPDMPVVVGRDLDIYLAREDSHRINSQNHIVFKGDYGYNEAKPIKCFWISGPLI